MVKTTKKPSKDKGKRLPAKTENLPRSVFEPVTTYRFKSLIPDRIPGQIMRGQMEVLLYGYI